MPGDLEAWIRMLASSQDPRIGANTAVTALRAPGLPTRPFAPEHARVFVCAGVIVKLHSHGTDPERLRRRLRGIGAVDIDRLWVQPLIDEPVPAPGERVATVWPRVIVLATVDRPPWADAGALLARLHRMPIEADPPGSGGPSRLARAASWLREAGRTDLAWLADLGDDLAERLARPTPATLTHGDFHLGQLGHTPLRRSWKLLDVDDFGVGDPAWDLARPAGFWAAGLLDDNSWQTFLEAYRDAGGPAVPQQGDPWPALDLPARAAVLVATVQALRHSLGVDTAVPLLAACRRMQAG